MKKPVKSKLSGLIALFVIISGLFLFKSCELAGDCMMCKKVTYENGEKISESDPVEYCGIALDDILDEEDVTIGNRTTRWECN
ncbi:MAG: hypothetical protein R6U58_02835 [Bacteroidales bacterium]